MSDFLYIKVWYDRTRNIVRSDNRLPVARAGLAKDTLVSIIDDYNYGITVYIFTMHYS